MANKTSGKKPQNKAAPPKAAKKKENPTAAGKSAAAAAPSEKKAELFRGKLTASLEKSAEFPLFVPLAALLCFAVMCGLLYLNGYKIFSSSFRVTGLFHCLYVGDFSVGLGSRLLIGSILSLFCDTVTSAAIDTFAKVSLIFVLICQAVLSGVIIRRSFAEKNIFMLLLAAIFTVCPLTVFAFPYFYGVLDLYNFAVFISSAAVLIKGKGSAGFIAAVMTVVGLLIHYSYFLAFFPALFVLALHRVVNVRGTALKREAAGLGVHSVLATGGFLYLSVIAKNHLVMTADEMIEYVHSKVDATVFIYDDYLKYYLYDIFRGTQMNDTGSSLSALVNINRELVNEEACISYLLFFAPVLLIFWGIFGYLAVKEKSVSRLPFIAACIMPLALVPELILSSDSWRWISSAALSVFFVLFGFIAMRVPSLMKLFDDMKKTKPVVKIGAAVILSAYFVWCLFYEHVYYG